jgi:hypothetical protein
MPYEGLQSGSGLMPIRAFGNAVRGAKEWRPSAVCRREQFITREGVREPTFYIYTERLNGEERKRMGGVMELLRNSEYPILATTNNRGLCFYSFRQISDASDRTRSEQVYFSLG